MNRSRTSKQFSIRYLIVGAFVLSIAIPSIIISIITFTSSVSSSLTNAQRQFEAIISLKQTQLVGFLNDLQDELAVTLSTPELLSLVEAALPSATSTSQRFVSQVRLSDTMSQVVNQNTNFQALVLVTPTGESVVTDTRDPVLLDENLPQAFIDNPTSGTLPVEAGDEVITAYAPILIDEEVVAFLVGIIPINRINSVIQSNSLGNTGSAFIIDSQRNPIVTYGAPTHSFTYISTAQANEAVVSYRGGDIIAVYLHVATIEATLGVVQSQSEILSPTYTLLLQNILVTLFSVIGVVVVVLWFIDRRLIRPIIQLSTVSNEFASGEFSQRSHITQKDEIGQLAFAFNLMADDLQSYITALQEVNVELEARILERTAELARAKDRAEHSDQVKSAFLASMSHELRTPLNAVINFTKFVARGDLGPVNDEQKETLGEVVNSAKHLLSLINDVLDMSKIESGSLNLFVTNDVNLNAIFQQIATTAKTLLEGKPVEIHQEINPNLPPIRADRQRLTQILLNIVSNACKFTDEGAIYIRAEIQNNAVVIAVQDTGPGIAPEDHQAVFEAFKQTATGLRKGGGTGLGMPITKSLVEAHGGTLALHSHLNEGATFIVTLPIASETLTPTLSSQRSLS